MTRDRLLVYKTGLLRLCGGGPFWIWMDWKSSHVGALQRFCKETFRLPLSSSHVTTAGSGVA